MFRIPSQRRWISVVMVAALLGACASHDKPKPTPLEPVTAQMSVRQLWTTRVDNVRFPLAMAAYAGGFVVAGGSVVLALQPDTGAPLWRGEAGSAITAGVGSDGRFAAVVTRDNELVVFDAGKVVWRAALSARVTTAPLVAGERVFVMGVDRAVVAFDAIDGRKLWALRRAGEPLTLMQQGVLAPFKNTLLVGQGPRLAGVDPLLGTLRWEVSVAAPRGTNEVERLADLVGPVLREGDVVCARAFQSAVGCVDAERGTTTWSKPVGGIEGVAGGETLVFGADASGRVTAWRLASGDVVWTSEKLLYRNLSAPVTVGRAVVFGDLEGQVHFLARDSGQTLLRLPTDGSQIMSTARQSSNIVLVATRNGGLYAFRAE